MMRRFPQVSIYTRGPLERNQVSDVPGLREKAYRVAPTMVYLGLTRIHHIRSSSLMV